MNSLTEIARCPCVNGEIQKAQIHHGLIASAIMKLVKQLLLKGKMEMLLVKHMKNSTIGVAIDGWQRGPSNNSFLKNEAIQSDHQFILLSDQQNLTFWNNESSQQKYS